MRLLERTTCSPNTTVTGDQFRSADVMWCTCECHTREEMILPWLLLLSGCTSAGKEEVGWGRMRVGCCQAAGWLSCRHPPRFTPGVPAAETPKPSKLHADHYRVFFFFYFPRLQIVTDNHSQNISVNREDE